MDEEAEPSRQVTDPHQKRLVSNHRTISNIRTIFLPENFISSLSCRRASGYINIGQLATTKAPPEHTICSSGIEGIIHLSLSSSKIHAMSRLCAPRLSFLRNTPRPTPRASNKTSPQICLPLCLQCTRWLTTFTIVQRGRETPGS